MADPPASSNRIVFIHPDLGIGGAERLVVDAAVGLQGLGYSTTFLTSHCDKTHCFDECRDGTLDVRVRGNTLIPPTILGRFSILCAILRQLHLFIQVALLSSELAELQPKAFVVDQLSACVPLLRFWFPSAPVLFYCHFPDRLLAQRTGLVKKLYRVPFDWLEAFTTGRSNVIVVNSKFTRSIFAQEFPGLKKRDPRVVYPCVDTSPKKKTNGSTDGEAEQLWKGKAVILSINRFERKKDIGLAIRAYAQLSPSTRQRARLVVAGGYDARVRENVAYHRELVELCTTLKLSSATADDITTARDVASTIDVVFLRSVPSSLKDTLLSRARLLVYTPPNEHFGIVPLEAMLARCPVLAATTGGPRETVLDGVTGWLRDTSVSEQWTDVMVNVLERMDEHELEKMGERGRERVLEKFSQQSMAKNLDDVIRRMRDDAKRPGLVDSLVLVVAACVLSIALAIGLQFKSYA